jgi:hypothetical protein
MQSHSDVGGAFQIHDRDFRFPLHSGKAINKPVRNWKFTEASTTVFPACKACHRIGAKPLWSGQAPKLCKGRTIMSSVVKSMNPRPINVMPSGRCEREGKCADTTGIAQSRPIQVFCSPGKNDHIRAHIKLHSKAVITSAALASSHNEDAQFPGFPVKYAAARRPQHVAFGSRGCYSSVI